MKDLLLSARVIIKPLHMEISRVRQTTNVLQCVLACTKTRNTGTPEHPGTPEHRIKFDGVVLFSYYRPCKKNEMLVYVICSGVFRCPGVFRVVPVFLVLVHAVRAAHTTLSFNQSSQ